MTIRHKWRRAVSASLAAATSVVLIILLYKLARALLLWRDNPAKLLELYQTVVLWYGAFFLLQCLPLLGMAALFAAHKRSLWIVATTIFFAAIPLTAHAVLSLLDLPARFEIVLLAFRAPSFICLAVLLVLLLESRLRGLFLVFKITAMLSIILAIVPLGILVEYADTDLGVNVPGWAPNATIILLLIAIPLTTMCLRTAWRRSRRPQASPPIDAAPAINLTCPRCQSPQSIPTNGGHCANCQLQIFIALDEGRCQNCRYPLRGLTSSSCPECGATIASSTTPPSA